MDFLFRLLKRVKLSETGTEIALKFSNNCFDVLTTVSLAQLQQKCGTIIDKQVYVTILLDLPPLAVYSYMSCLVQY